MTNKVRPEPTIPDHEVYRKIGGGSYGEVWLAQGVTGAMRAVKVVWHDNFDDERGFEREFEGIKKYEPVSRDHVGLVKILHVGRGEAEGEAFYYYVMELGDDIRTERDINPVEYEARTLRSDMLRAEKTPLDVDFCIEAGRELADGLDHLHKHGLAHRDVKPANVIFVEGKAKLADIGLVALRGQKTFVGTEGFVPPEGPGSTQADVYSLGKVLYEMATGKDRLEFPDLPEELPQGKSLKCWRSLNEVICDVCEPRVSKRKITTAEQLANELKRLQLGRRRPIRVNRPLVFTVLAIAAVIGLIWQLPTMKISLADDAQSEVVTEPEVTPEVFVTVTSSPLGAAVQDADGIYIADTPLVPRKFPLDAELVYTFHLEGFREKTITATITQEAIDEGVLIIAPQLDVYAPPVDGDPWEDVLGERYKGVEDYHVSHYYVGRRAWNLFRKETGKKFGEVVETTENGILRYVIFCKENEAKQFADWLEDESRESYLTPHHEMEARMDLTTTFRELSEEVVRAGLRPFRMEVRRIPYASIAITSEPFGADVYLDGQWRGVTPLELRVNPDVSELEIEREGYRPERRELSLSNGEVWEKPMNFVLKQSGRVVFDREWTNSIGMKLVPLTNNLLASVWETRVKDYEEYVKATKTSRPRRPGFAQTEDHPVVYVSPDDARGFCEWLTEVEQKKELIKNNHRYRLPTDAEWSAMVELPREPGLWPFQRSEPPTSGYPWGEWPPEEGSGNYSDQTSVTQGAQPATKLIEGYDDGFAYTAPVGSGIPNPLGIFDLGGNVHEWVEDWYSPQEAYNVARGGGWNSYQPHNMNSSFRNPVSKDGDSRDDSYGFRVVLEKEDQSLEEEGEER